MKTTHELDSKVLTIAACCGTNGEDIITCMHASAVYHFNTCVAFYTFLLSLFVRCILRDIWKLNYHNNN